MSTSQVSDRQSSGAGSCAPINRRRNLRHVASGRRYQPLVIVAAAVCGGMIADRSGWPWVPGSFELWWVAAAIGLVAWLLLWRREWPSAAIATLLVAVAAAGAAWHHAHWYLYEVDEIGRVASGETQPCCLEIVASSAGQVTPPPRFDPLRTIPAKTETRFTAQVVGLRDGFVWKAASGQMRVWLNGAMSDVKVGERMQVFGLLSAPLPPANPGEFDFAKHARGDRELSVVRIEFPECIRRIQPASPWSVTYWIDELRQTGNRMLDRYVSRDHLPLASALLLGQRTEIDRETNDAFLRTGTIHVLSISGLHVAILAGVLFKAFRTGWMSRRTALVGVGMVTGLYMLLTGAEPPVVRATLLVWVVCGSLWLGRTGVSMNSLAMAALVVLAINPADLFRTGVLLSFLSVSVLMWVVPILLPPRDVDPLDRLIFSTRPWPERLAIRAERNLKAGFAMGMILWLLIAPITMARFHLLSPAALILNLVIAPLVTIVMGAGFGLLTVGWLAPPLGAFLGGICNGCLFLLELVVESIAHWPGSYLWTAGPSDVWLVGLYAAAAIPLIVAPAAVPTRWRWATVCAWCGLAAIASLPGTRTEGELRCTFVSVGHGCAVVLELPDGKTLLYDAGRLGSPLAAERSVSGYLWSRHINHLDAVVVSHADADHYNALPALLDKFTAGAIYVGPRMFEDQTAALELLRQSFQGSGAQLGELYAGDQLRVDQHTSVEVLHPPASGVAGSDNANSIILLVEYCGKRVLLTGDLESPGLESLMNEPRLDCDVVLAPHHGSGRSDPPGFAAWSQPEFVVISCGSGDDSTSVREAYEARSAVVLNTAECGAVTAVIHEDGLEVETFHAADVLGRRD